MITLAVIYLAGVLISYWMVRVDHASEGEVFTKGDQALTLLTALFSFIAVLFLLVITWVQKIAKSGYWKKPVKPETE